MSGALLVAGTTSDASKSVLIAGLCRWLARGGVRVAPFNSMVTADGTAPEPSDIRRAVRLSRAVVLASAALAVCGRVAVRRGLGRRR